MNDTQTRLLINPITKTIIPKYRNQKAVYVAKGDHKSVSVIFEMPRYVDGHDLSEDEYIIQIHFVNLSEDGKNYSKGISEAISREIEGDNLSFAWLVDNRATRYAGVVSVGITIEKYASVDGKAEEVYSWSTAPYGNTKVWDSHDNSSSMTEQEYDYLVATVNTLVTLSLQNKLSEVEKNIDDKVAYAESRLVAYTTAEIIEFDNKASGAIENFNRNANEALGEINNRVAETERNAQDAAGSAHLARDRMELAKSWAVGDTGYREYEDTDNAKFYSEETSKQVILAQQKVEEAQQTVEEAQSLRDDVQTYPPIAERHARTAESWARGGTGIREGEDTDNAKYYSEQIGNHANDAKNYAKEAEQHANDAEAAADLAWQHSNVAGSYVADSIQFANEAKGYADEAKGYAEKAADEANNANVAKSEAERIAEQTHSYVGEAQQYAGEAQQHAEEAQLRARDSGVSSMTASEYAEESRNSANEAKGYAEQAQNAVVGINTPYANALKGEASGTMVSMKDVSPIEHKIDVELGSKNLFYINATKKANSYGIEYDLTEGKSSFILNGTTTKDASFNISVFTLKAGTYTVSIFGTNNITSDMDRIFLRYTDASGTAITVNNIMADVPKTFTLTCESSVRIDAVIASNSTYSNKEVSIQIEEGTVATAYTPFVADVSKAKLYRTGKNLIPYPYKHTTRTQNGITFTDNGDGSITVNGTATASTFFDIAPIWGEYNLPAGSYFLSGCPAGGSASTYRLTLAFHSANYPEGAHSFDGSDRGQGTIAKVSEDVARIYCRIVIVQGFTANNLVFKPQLEKGTVATEYELYIEPVEVDKDNVTSLYPTTTLYSDTSGVLIEAKYNRDLNKVIAELYNAITNL
jgi:hypothetical protein